jgi:Xaa-Pro aminopeptidase
MESTLMANLAALVLLTTCLTPAHQEDPQTSLARPGDGRLVCGLGKAFHQGRRTELMKRVGPELVVLRGEPDPRENLAFRQDKNFWYLTGVESANAALVLDGKSGRAILFLPERTRGLALSESWEGEKWDNADDWVGELTGFGEVRATEKLVETVKELLDGRTKIGVCLQPTIVLAGSTDAAGPYDEAQEKDELDGRPDRAHQLATKLAELLKVDTVAIDDQLLAMRHVKTPEEIDAMRRAARAGARAQIEGMRSTAPRRGEWEIEAVMSFVQMREGADGPAYAAIVGGGKSACILHYVANSRRLVDGEMLLVDFGPEVDHYTTDITRSWPVSGVFSERQAQIYDAVLAAQKAGIAACKPGATLRDVDVAAWKVLEERGFPAKHWKRHDVCHFIGMEVHDPGLYRQAVEPGVAFTVEPGLYELETGIGVRIEDVVVITKDGCEVITSEVPKERAEVEGLVKSTGLLDGARKAE